MKAKGVKFHLRPSFETILILFLASGFATEAYGYIDPGSGFMALQAIAAVFAAIAFNFRRIIRFFKRRSDRPDAETTESQPADKRDEHRDVG